MFSRKLYPQLQAHVLHKQVTVLTGMRRTGKTTLVKALLNEIPSKNKIYMDLERVDYRELFQEKNYENILLALRQRGLKTDDKMHIALDEIQLVPNIASALKYLYDHFDVKFIVTGSSSYYLKNLFSESLAGRKKIFELYPLDFGEFLGFKNVSWSQEKSLPSKFISSEYERLKVYYEEFIMFGGFPEVVLADQIQQKKDLLTDIVSSYINIDIQNLADVRRSTNIYTLLKLLASRAANRLDISKISVIAGLSRATVQSYVDLFEKTYFITRVPVFTGNADREVVKAKKIYFADTGLLNILAEVSSGVQFENTVFNQLQKIGDVRYYALKSGREIDFIVNKKMAYETKESPTQQDQKVLENLSKNIGIQKCRLVGRHAVPYFSDFLWGGSVF